METETVGYIFLALGIISYFAFLALPTGSSGGGFISFGELRGIVIVLILCWGILGNFREKLIGLFLLAVNVSIFASPAFVYFGPCLFGKVWFTICGLLAILVGVSAWWSDDSSELYLSFYLGPLSLIFTAIAFYLV